MNAYIYSRLTAFLAAACVALAATGQASLNAGESDKPEETKKPVKVYILSGQSNMVGIGQVDGRGQRWGDEFIDPVVSVYQGEYDPDIDYDKQEPINQVELESFGGVKPQAYPGGGVQVVRGHIVPKTTGIYELRPGYGGSSLNIMEIDGQEVYRKEVGKNATYNHIKLTEGEKVPFKITYLTDDAGGLGWIARMDVPGTLKTVTLQDGKFPYLLDEEKNWAKRDDVWYRGVVTDQSDGPLSVETGGNTIGPELGFGHYMGEYHDQPVLIIKTSQGNRSLAWDFCPPGTERFEHTDSKGTTWVYAGYKDRNSRWEKGTEPEEPKHDWYAGKQYDDCFTEVHRLLDNFDTEFPQYAGQGYEIAGFAWWQGHKDSGSPAYAERYEQNLVHLIKTLRKEFDAPDAPFVVATIGFGGWDMAEQYLPIANAQLAVSGDKGNYPEFKGNVKTVETRDFWRTPEQSPRNQDFHYNGNAETYMLVGEAIGKGMLELKKSQAD